MKPPTLTAIDGTSTTNDPKARAFFQGMEEDILARTLWGEARGEGESGMEAVACVILNRCAISAARKKYWWGNNIIQICQKPYQFSCWNRSDPNYRKLQAVDLQDPDFARARQIARRALIGGLSDTTNGATHYHARGIMPVWAQSEIPCARIGHHIFYRLV
jgi:spore germination cell wall hydrolase CwlJ-like protein